MWRKTNLLFLAVISVLINHTFSAVMWYLEETDKIKGVRSTKRNESVYRGVLLSYSALEKNMLCQDFFHAQLYAEVNSSREKSFGSDSMKTTELTRRAFKKAKKDTQGTIEGADETIGPKVTDELTNHGEPLHTLVLKKLIIGKKLLSDEEDIFFKCSIRRIKVRIPDEKEYLLSFAFRSGWFYAGPLDNELEDHVWLDHYMGISPEYVELNTQHVEKKYMKMLQTINKLKEESPEYGMLIEGKDDLSALTRWQKFILCASILSSPIYRNINKSVRLEASIKWIKTTEAELAYVKRQVSFMDEKYGKIKIDLDCILCRGFEDYFLNPEDMTDLYITRSYEDKDSVYVLEENNYFEFYPSKYFRKVPVLMNAKEIIAEGNIFKIYGY